jgi:dihydroneopterin aldolase
VTGWAGADVVALRGLRGRGRHGWYDHERAEGQDFEVDVELAVDTRAAAASDDLADTVDYGTLAADVVAIVEGEPVRLVETLAQRVADRCLDDPRVRAARVTVHKPQAPMRVAFRDVVVVIERTQADR